MKGNPMLYVAWQEETHNMGNKKGWKENIRNKRLPIFKKIFHNDDDAPFFA